VRSIGEQIELCCCVANKCDLAYVEIIENPAEVLVSLAAKWFSIYNSNACPYDPFNAVHNS
jgi:regulator of RNase E activity RraB